MMVQLTTDEAQALQAVRTGRVRVASVAAGDGLPEHVTARALDGLLVQGYVMPAADGLVRLTHAGEAIATPGLAQHLRAPRAGALTSGTKRGSH